MQFFETASPDQMRIVFDDGSEAVAPRGHRLWNEELEPFLAGGGVPDPYVALAAQIPQVVSKLQGKAALLQAGLLEQVKVIMADPATDPLAVLAWTDGDTFRRDSPALMAIAQKLNFTNEQLDQLFVAASAITI